MQTASNRALALLVKKYKEEFDAIYKEEKEATPGEDSKTYKEQHNVFARAYGRAKIKLSHRHPEDYKVFYRKAIQEGYTATFYKKKSY